MIRCLVLGVFIIAVLMEAGAQAIQNPRKVKAFGDKEAADSLDLYNLLHDNAPGDFPASGVPYVTVVGNQGRFVVGAGGFVKALMGWDFGHPIPNPDEFITSEIPMHPMSGDGGRFNLSARQTHLFVNFVGFPGTSHEVGAFVSANFLSDDYMPVLQYAYLKYRGLKAGYDNTIFSDPACGPPTVDYEGPSSNTCSPVAGIGYTWRHSQWELQGGFQLPQYSFTVIPGRTTTVTQRMPDIPLGVRYSWGGGSCWARASAIFRLLTYRDEVSRSNSSRPGYGFQMSGSQYFLDRFTFFWQGVWGKGIASLVQDTADQGLDLTPSAGGTSMTTPMMWGGFLCLRCDICQYLATSATYSQVRTYAERYADADAPWGDLYKYAQYISANAFLSLSSYFEVGVEYIWGRRTDYSGLKCADNRIQGSLQFTF